MSALLEAIRRHAEQRPHARALDDLSGRTLSWSELVGAVESRVRTLEGLGLQSLGLLCDNGTEWVLQDLAAHEAGIATVPLPTFFAESQLGHVCRTTGLEAVVTDQPGRAEALGFEPRLAMEAGGEWLAVGEAEPTARFQKITFTSGTTGTPKGVCLGRPHLETVARVLAEATGSLPSDIHLCALPLSILLENVAGVHRSLLSGGTVLAPPLARVGMLGAQQFDPFQCLTALRETESTSVILVPEMLRGLLFAARGAEPTRLRYAGVGGARVAPALLEEARACRFPAYEGYGLSEFASVVALNTLDDFQLGASGRPLPHVRIRIAERDEIEIRGPHYLGYLTPEGLEPPQTTPDGFLATGDRGELGEDGFLRVTGRLRNVLITSYGRNVSPEWVESELMTHPAVAQAVVYGDGEPALGAVIVARGAPAMIPEHLAAVNARLPDYARIARCVVTSRPFQALPGLTHATGMPRREAVVEHFAHLAVDSPCNPHPPMEKETWAFTLGS